jgi:hypothetical protein
LSRVKEERLPGEGENGMDLLRYTDNISGEIVKEISVRPIEEEQKVRTINRERKQLEVEKPLLSAAEMTQLAVKAQNDTVGKRVNEVIRGMLDSAAENVLSGKYIHLLDRDEVSPKLTKDIISALKGLGYTVRKKERTDGDTNLTISWKTTKPKTQKAKSSTVKGKERTMQEESPSTDMAFEFEPKKT